MHPYFFEDRLERISIKGLKRLILWVPERHEIAPGDEPGRVRTKALGRRHHAVSTSFALFLSLSVSWISPIFR